MSQERPKPGDLEVWDSGVQIPESGLQIENWKSSCVNCRTSWVACLGVASACNAGDPVQSLTWEDPLEKEMATHSSMVA